MISFRVLKSFDASLISKLIKLEVDNLGGEAAINQWQLPVIIRYGKFVVAENENGDIIGVCEMLRQWGHTEQDGQAEQAGKACQVEQIGKTGLAGKAEPKVLAKQAVQAGQEGLLPGAFIHSFYIEETYRHRGIGKNLLENVIDILKKDGFKSVRLTVGPENEPALKLYGGFGFEKKELEVSEYGEGRDRYLLELVFDGK